MRPEFDYDADADILFVRFTAAKLAVASEVAPGVVLHFDEAGRVAAFEASPASRVIGPEVAEKAARVAAE